MKEKICLVCAYNPKTDGGSIGCYLYHKKMSKRHTYQTKNPLVKKLLSFRKILKLNDIILI